MRNDIHPQAYVVTDPAAEPVTVADFKAHVRVDGSDEDTLIETYIASARQMYENYTSRVLITSAWKQAQDDVPAGREIVLFRGPVASVTAIKYLDEAGATQTFAGANYTTDLLRTPARIWLNDNADWPDVGDFPSCFWVEFSAGYGASGTNTPARARLAVTLLAAHLYEHRLPLNIGNIVNELPFSLRHLLEQDRLFLV